MAESVQTEDHEEDAGDGDHGMDEVQDPSIDLIFLLVCHQNAFSFRTWSNYGTDIFSELCT